MADKESKGVFMRCEIGKIRSSSTLTSILSRARERRKNSSAEEKNHAQGRQGAD